MTGRRKPNRALLLVITGLARTVAWLTLIVLYLMGFMHALFESIPFVACISLYANAATDWGQVTASLAEMTASDRTEERLLRNQSETMQILLGLAQAHDRDGDALIAQTEAIQAVLETLKTDIGKHGG